MPLDPQAEAVIKLQEAAGEPPLHTLSPALARAIRHARPVAKGPEVARSYNTRIPGPAGAVPARVYVPFGDGPFPCLVYYHGGGWVIGTLDMSDGTCRHLCTGGGCVVVSVDYRLAPEAKFPLPAEECYAAAQWVHGHAPSLDVDPRRVAVGGGSAGANLAAAVALMARDRGGPPLVHQLLVYPVTDRNFNTPSYIQNGAGYMLTCESMIWYWDHYLSSPADAQNPYAAPLQAKDVSRLPPALVITAEYDPLRDEGEAYARRLQDAGVSTHYSCYPGMIHGFFGMHEAVDKARQAVEEACGALRQAFALGLR
ncbi:MAG: alpha/beta hydrolase [Chloroflexi bacterium]|nr:alpha/beta hydrolase [Chloroflexota bacterium]